MDAVDLSRAARGSTYDSKRRADLRGTPVRRAVRRANELRAVALDVTTVDTHDLMRGARRPDVAEEVTSTAVRLMTMRFAVDVLEGSPPSGGLPAFVPEALRLIAWFTLYEPAALVRLVEAGDDLDRVDRGDFFEMLDGHSRVISRAHREVDVLDGLGRRARLVARRARPAHVFAPPVVGRRSAGPGRDARRPPRRRPATPAATAHQDLVRGVMATPLVKRLPRELPRG